MEKLFSIPEFVRRFRVGRSTVYRLNAAGQLPFLKIGRATRIAESDALRCLDSLPRQGGDPSPSL